MIAKTLALSLMMLTVAVAAGDAPQPAQVRVFRVFDGDSFLARTRARSQRVRVYGVDAPEPGQGHGAESRAILEKMIGGEVVAIEPVATAPDGYVVARVRSGDHDIGAALVRAGAAWAVPSGHPEDRELMALEREAREGRRGLWATGDPVPPWEWRSQQAGAVR